MYRFFLSFIFVLNIFSCNGFEDPLPIEEDIAPELISFNIYGRISLLGQGSAVYKGYLIILTSKMSAIALYDLEARKKLYTLKLAPQEERTIGGNILYHCNQCSFGNTKYVKEDFFPLLYVSQKNHPDSNRCFIDVLRIVLNEDMGFSIEKVQKIYLPPMTKQNSMGNANACIDLEHNSIVVYSRNNNKNDSNYHLCRISRFPLPNIETSEVIYEDSDILESYDLGIDAMNMQGAYLRNGKLYISRGIHSANYIFLYVVDLKKRKLVKQYDLLNSGMKYEPEGCFFYNGNTMLTAGNYLVTLKNIIQ